MRSKAALRNPDPATIRAARTASGLSQSAAAALIYSSLRSWQAWESGERRMHPGARGRCGSGAQARGEEVERDASHGEAGAGEELAAREVIEVGVGGIHRRASGRGRWLRA